MIGLSALEGFSYVVFVLFGADVNSRQRMQTAMSLGMPDRVPLMCQMSIGHMLLNLDVSPVEFWWDAGTFADGLIALRDRYDFDGVLVSLHGHDTDWRSRVLRSRLTPEGEEVFWRDGSRTVHARDELPRYLPAGDAPTGPEKTLLPDRLEYIPVTQGVRFKIDLEHEFDILHLVRRKIGEGISLHGEVTSPFDYYLDFVGHQEGLLGLIDSPAKAKEILDHFTRLVRDCAVRMCATGIDAMKVSSPYAGAGFISRGFYSEFVLPCEAEIARAVRSTGVHLYTHTCGAVGDRLDLMLSAGISGIECLDPPPLGNVDLSEAKSILAGRAFIKGNIDSVNVLVDRSPDEILADAKRRIEVGKIGGGFILSTACSVAPRVPPKHVLLLREAVERWGQYEPTLSIGGGRE